MLVSDTKLAEIDSIMSDQTGMRDDTISLTK